MLREVKEPVEGHTASEWQKREWAPKCGIMKSEAVHMKYQALCWHLKHKW